MYCYWMQRKVLCYFIPSSLASYLLIQFPFLCPLKEHLDIPYQCRGGICNSCVGKLIKGSVDQLSEQANILSTKAREKGYVLTCVARPTSDLELYVDMELEYIKDPDIW